MARWGTPTPPQFLKGPVDRSVTNIRNTNSPHWRAWMKPEFRCLVPATSFCEPTDLPDPATGRKRWTWFALGVDRPLFAFAGIWCAWRGIRGTLKNLVDGEHTLYGFLTTEPNAVVRPIHSKAMPVVLTEPAEWNAWLAADIGTALELQRPLPADRLHVVALHQREGDIEAPAGRAPRASLRCRSGGLEAAPSHRGGHGYAAKAVGVCEVVQSCGPMSSTRSPSGRQ
jgi:putative SOS response-associated peptidase YedK